MYYMYIIRSKKDSSFYIGQCQNLSQRLLKHNNGYTNSTKAKKPWDLVYHEEYQTRSEAVRREREIKKQKSHKYIEELIFKFSKPNIMGL
ncbi:MAG: GIY-YIG nuclease family protein [Nitrospirae bacterium]|nr:GIY-YIG nuclease family protein [Nitrospirota bacterium]